MTTYQTPDAKKEEFRKYLEKSGVIDALTKVLVGLYEEPERPPNAVDYIKRYMGAPTNVDVEAIRAENEELKAQVKELRQTLEEGSKGGSIAGGAVGGGGGAKDVGQGSKGGGGEKS